MSVSVFEKGALIVRNFIISLGLTILLPLIVDQGVRVFVSKPETVIKAEEGLGALDKKIYASDASKAEKAEARKEAEALKKITGDWRKKFDRTYFIAMTAVGIIALFFGLMTTSAYLGIGLIIGGLGCITQGYWSYWEHLSNLILFISLLFIFLLMSFMLWRATSKK